ncbi:hypothetical protein Hdeb2414_s0010g00352481 [Helianthus debilis subsp. tardiflorus]
MARHPHTLTLSSSLSCDEEHSRLRRSWSAKDDGAVGASAAAAATTTTVEAAVRFTNDKDLLMFQRCLMVMVVVVIYDSNVVRASRFGSIQASQRIQYDSTWFQFTWFSKFRARFRFRFGSRVTGQILKWCGRLGQTEPTQLTWSTQRVDSVNIPTRRLGIL